MFSGPRYGFHPPIRASSGSTFCRPRPSLTQLPPWYWVVQEFHCPLVLELAPHHPRNWSLLFLELGRLVSTPQLPNGAEWQNWRKEATAFDHDGSPYPPDLVVNVHDHMALRLLLGLG